jgi:hypothetical protein
VCYQDDQTALRTRLRDQYGGKDLSSTATYKAFQTEQDKARVTTVATAGTGTGETTDKDSSASGGCGGDAGAAGGGGTSGGGSSSLVNILLDVIKMRGLSPEHARCVPPVCAVALSGREDEVGVNAYACLVCGWVLWKER